MCSCDLHSVNNYISKVVNKMVLFCSFWIIILCLNLLVKIILRLARSIFHFKDKLLWNSNKIKTLLQVLICLRSLRSWTAWARCLRWRLASNPSSRCATLTLPDFSRTREKTQSCPLSKKQGRSIDDFGYTSFKQSLLWMILPECAND